MTLETTDLLPPTESSAPESYYLDFGLLSRKEFDLEPVTRVFAPSQPAFPV